MSKKPINEASLPNKLLDKITQLENKIIELQQVLDDEKFMSLFLREENLKLNQNIKGLMVRLELVEEQHTKLKIQYLKTSKRLKLLNNAKNM